MPRKPAAGVNTSDVEVNLKIALSRPMRDGRITRDERNTLLASLTDDVASLYEVLHRRFSRYLEERSRTGDLVDGQAITIVALAARIAKQADTSVKAVGVVRDQTSELGGVARINDSGVRILHSARALRKVAVGK